MVELSCLGWNVGLYVLDVLLNAFPNDLLPYNCIEEDVELDDDLLEVVLLIGILLSHEEAVLLLQDVLDLTDDMGPPDDFPIFLGVE